MNLLRPILLVSVVAVAVAVAPVALAGNPTPAAVKALEIRGQALNERCDNPTLSSEAFRALCGSVGAQNQPTRAELNALEIRGQALDQQCDNPTLSREAFRTLCGNAGAQNQPTRSELKALEIRGQAMNKIAAGQVTHVVRSSGFDWSDFGIGAGAMLGFVLLSGGVAGAYYSRKNRVRPQTVA